MNLILVRKRSAAGYSSVFTNLGLLGFFKYFGFFVNEFAVVVEAMGLNVSIPTLNIILPVGISFYTFQTLSYTIDVYRGVTKPTRNLLDFGVYVSFFPQLVAGPIERSKDLMPQILKERKLDKGAFSEGLYHVLFGMFKKVVIADNMAPIVDRIFSTPTAELASTEILFGIYAFSIQIYCDFSGYSSIAQGIAKWLGINLSWNFKMPYFSRTPSEFWQRWHITLSSWLRDYLYISLGGNRVGTAKTFRNLVLTMGLGGLWHGAAWTFVVWGLIHGAILVIYQAAESAGLAIKNARGLIRIISMIVFFHLVCATWIYFRADSLSQANEMLLALFSSYHMTDLSLYILGMLAFFCLPMLILEQRIERSGTCSMCWVFAGRYVPPYIATLSSCCSYFRR